MGLLTLPWTKIWRANFRYPSVSLSVFAWLACDLFPATYDAIRTLPFNDVSPQAPGTSPPPIYDSSGFHVPFGEVAPVTAKWRYGAEVREEMLRFHDYVDLIARHDVAQNTTVYVQTAPGSEPGIA